MTTKIKGIKEDLEGLIFVEGTRFERIKSILDEKRIPYDAEGPTILQMNQRDINNFPLGFGYFRIGVFFIHPVFTEEVTSFLRDMFGEGGVYRWNTDDEKSGRVSRIDYDGFYSLGNSFDITSLNGRFRFDRGRLVERTQIKFIVYKKSKKSKI